MNNVGTLCTCRNIMMLFIGYIQNMTGMAAVMIISTMDWKLFLAQLINIFVWNINNFSKYCGSIFYKTTHLHTFASILCVNFNNPKVTVKLQRHFYVRIALDRAVKPMHIWPPIIKSPVARRHFQQCVGYDQPIRNSVCQFQLRNVSQTIYISYVLIGFNNDLIVHFESRDTKDLSRCTRHINDADLKMCEITMFKPLNICWEMAFFVQSLWRWLLGKCLYFKIHGDF